MPSPADPDRPDLPFDAAIAGWLSARASDPGAFDADVAAVRAYNRTVSALAREGLAHLETVAHEEDVLLPGEPAVKARVFRPRTHPGPLPSVVYFHGGGWIAGDLYTHLTHCRQICAGLPAVVVSVDYRLAPEHPFPAAFDDCLAATRAVLEAVGRFGGDPARVVVAGDSAGGQLAASVGLAAASLPAPLAGQLLIVPVIDLAGGYLDAEVNARYPSRSDNRVGYGLTVDRMASFVGQYLQSGGAERDWRASPLHAASVAGAPPAVIHTAGFDPLRNEGAAYADMLRRAGVRVKYRCWPTLNHGYSGLAGIAPAAAAAVDAASADLRELLTAR